MIKRVIFDIDNTLIPWKKEYNDEIRKTLEDLKIMYTDKDLKQISQAFYEYENEYYTFDRKLMLDFINKYTKKQYPEEFIYNILDRWSTCIPDKIEKETKETLEYLKSKYELVILTDWYAKQQIKRLEKLDVLKYFQNVYSAEKIKRKPFKESFIQAIGEHKPEECIMIGDDLERDIRGALDAGLQAIWYCPNNKELNTDYQTILKIEELKNIL